MTGDEIAESYFEATVLDRNALDFDVLGRATDLLGGMT